MTKLTDNFYLSEFITSQEARRRGINNSLPEILRPNLSRLATSLQRCRNYLKQPIIITSGYRCPSLNKAIRGAHNSDHTFAAAADWICPAYGTPYEICVSIAPKMDEFGIGQIIYEFDWVHISIIKKEPINRVLTYRNGTYEVGLKSFT